MYSSRDYYALNVSKVHSLDSPSFSEGKNLYPLKEQRQGAPVAFEITLKLRSITEVNMC